MSVEKVRALSEPAAKQNLFERKRIVEIFGEKFSLKRLTRKEMYESGISYLSSLITNFSRELEKDLDIEKKKKIIEEIEKTQYEFERKLLLNCVEDLDEERLDNLDMEVWRELLSKVVEFNFLTSLRSLGRLESRGESPPNIL